MKPQGLCTDSLKLRQKPHVAIEKEAQIVNAIAEHGHAFEAHTKGEAGVFFGVDAAVFQHEGMHHPATENLDEALTLTQAAALATALEARDVHLGGGLGEGEVVGPETHLGLLTVHLLGEDFESTLEVTHGDALIDHQAFNLEEGG